MMYYTGGVSGFGTDKTYTSDFETFTTPVADSSMAGMDEAMKLDSSSGTYYLANKDQSSGFIELSSASSPDGTFTTVKGDIGSGTIPSGEGPYLFQDNSDSSVVSGGYPYGGF